MNIRIKKRNIEIIVEGVSSEELGKISKEVLNIIDSYELRIEGKIMDVEWKAPISNKINGTGKLPDGLGCRYHFEINGEPVERG